MTARPLRHRRGLPVAVACVLPLAMGAALLPVTAVSASVPTAGARVVAPAAKPVGAAPAVFSRLPGFRLDRSARVTVAPRAYAGYSLQLSSVRGALAAAPTQAEVDGGAKPLVFQVPAPDGTLTKFAVAEDSVMEPALQAAHPEIRSYAGRSVSGPSRSIRLDTGPLGFHASVRVLGGGRSWYVDPAYVGSGVSPHISYYGAAVPRSAEAFVERGPLDTRRIESSVAPQVSTTPGGVVTQRLFRMAFVTDPTYAAYFGGTEAGVLAAKVALLNRTDQIYNDDLAIKFLLINGTDKLNLDTYAKFGMPNGPCGASACYDPLTSMADPATAGDTPDGCTGALLTRNEFVLGQLVGADSFDIGHIGLGVNGGGIAGLGVVGGASKADGCTGLPQPTGDFYAVDYFSHEVGHEMGGNHTFNGTQLNCSTGNRNAGIPILEPSTGVEPGSGSSVMAYAGICGSDNLQPHSDPYFSQRSIDEITDTTSAAPGSEDEVQTVTLSSFDAGDTIKLGFGSAAPITLTNGPTTYNAISLTLSLQGLTGCLVTVGDYDSNTPLSVSDDGFTVSFSNPLDCSGADQPRLTVSGGTGGATGFVGVQVNGGDDTNIGFQQKVTANHAPVVTAPADKTIPIRTPFTLTGTATDSDQDPLTYLWEQNDSPGTTGTGLVDNTKTDGPLFRVFGTYADVTAAGTLQTPSPGENVATADTATRTFPDLAQVLSDNTNAETGACPEAGTTLPVPRAIVDCFSEFLPTADYTQAAVPGLPPLADPALHFRLTARDQAPDAGGTAFDEVALTVDSAAGPFAVTSRAVPGDPGTAGTNETVTWAVNSTETLAPMVKISLSADGGQTFPYVVAATTPNDGSQAIQLPDVTTSHARIKVEAVDNYFFDVNDADFAINGPLTVTSAGTGTVQYSDVLGGVTVTALSSKVDAADLAVAITGPAGITLGPATRTATGVRPSTATFPVQGTITAAPGTYPVTVKATEGTGPSAPTASTTFDVVVTPEDATATYTGAKKFTSAGTPTAQVPLQATVTDAVDPTRGLISRARVGFVNRTSGQLLCVAPVVPATGSTTTGTASCTATLPATTGAGTNYTIGTVVGASYTRNSQADDAVITVVRGAADTVAPNTAFTSGARNNTFVKRTQAVFGLGATEKPATFRCLFDRRVISCGKGVRTPVLTTGITHVLTVAARDAAGNLDKTPAVRQFAAPYTVAQLTRATGSWTPGRDAQSYRGTYLTTKFSGQTLTRTGSGITKISIVYTQLPNAGRVGVYLGTRLLRVVSTNGPRTKKQVLVLSKAFGTKMSGTVKLMTMDDKPVRIEGLGLLQPRIG